MLNTLSSQIENNLILPRRTRTTQLVQYNHTSAQSIEYKLNALKTEVTNNEIRSNLNGNKTEIRNRMALNTL